MNDEESSLLEVMQAIIQGSYFGPDRHRFPQVDIIIVLDIMSVLVRSGRMTFKQVANRLNSRPNPDTLRKYLKILVELRLVSIDSKGYRGIARAKKFFQATDRGKEFVFSTGKILSE